VAIYEERRSSRDFDLFSERDIPIHNGSGSLFIQTPGQGRRIKTIQLADVTVDVALQIIWSQFPLVSRQKIVHIPEVLVALFFGTCRSLCRLTSHECIGSGKNRNARRALPPAVGNISALIP
jgi:hypothetical protein